MTGQIVVRRQLSALQSGAPKEHYYRFSGKQMGLVSNDGTLNTDYSASIANRTAGQGTGLFRNGATASTPYADFDQSVPSINSYYQGSGSGGYIARAGDTLSSIAASLWGDSALWYQLADANGFASDVALSEGQSLTIPAGAIKNTHNASTFTPYDPTEIIGDTTPSRPAAPKPKRQKCGGIGQFILIVIAVVVSFYVGPAVGAWIQGGGAAAGGAAAGGVAAAGATGGVAGGAGLAGVGAAATGAAAATASLSTTAAIIGGAAGAAAGSIVSQAVGVATGIQEKFSWNAVALAAIGGGVGGGVAASKSLQGVIGRLSGGSDLIGVGITGAARSAIAQGIGVATGMQEKFSWAGIASAAVGAMMGAKFSDSGPFTRMAAETIADAGARTLIEGSDFGDNLMAALPSVIGQTIGNAVAGEIASGGFGRGIGKAFAAIGDTLGFDGEFGYDGVDGPSGAGRHLSLAGLGGAVGDVVGLDGQFGQQGLYPPTQVALEGDAGAYMRQLSLRNLGRAIGGAAKVGARGLGILAGPLVDLALADSAGGGETFAALEGMGGDLRLRHLSSEVGWHLEQARLDQGIFGPYVDWNGVGTAMPDGNLLMIQDPARVSQLLGRDLGVNAIVLSAGDGSDGPRIGFGVSIQNDDERMIVNDGIGLGWDSNRINSELDFFRSSFGTATSLAGGGSVWDLGWAKRGIEIERGILGDRYGLLPAGFRTIDDFNNGLATSIKSINLNAQSYSNIGRLDRLLTGYVNRVSGFESGSRGGVQIEVGDVTARSLIIAVPNRGTVAQQAAINRAVTYGAAQPNPVNVVVRTYP